MLLEVTFGKLYSWAIHNVRNILLEASARFKELGEQPCQKTIVSCCPIIVKEISLQLFNGLPLRLKVKVFRF